MANGSVDSRRRESRDGLYFIHEQNGYQTVKCKQIQKVNLWSNKVTSYLNNDFNER